LEAEGIKESGNKEFGKSAPGVADFFYLDDFPARLRERWKRHPLQNLAGF
jgi:hypothetical protein